MRFHSKDVGLLGIPLGFGAATRGSGLGTRTMRQALVRGKRLHEHLADLGYSVRDWGDVEAPRPTEDSDENPKFITPYFKSLGQIVPAVQSILHANEFPVILGGDHSIALGTVSAISSFYKSMGQDVGLIWFDAHGDLNTPDTSPSGNLHGMPLAHILGKGMSVLHGLEGFSPKIKPQYVAHVGARDLDPQEKALIKELNLRCWTMHDLDRYGMNRCIEQAIEVASAAPGGFIVTFDVDVLDPLDAPGSGTLVRGGIFYREAHLALERIAESKRMVSFEIVEVNPMLDHHNRTSELAIELILSAMGKTIL